MGKRGNSGGGGGPSAKDSYSPPIDNYRKRIGKQHVDVNRKSLRQLKQQQETKDNLPKALNQMVYIPMCLNVIIL